MNHRDGEPDDGKISGSLAARQLNTMQNSYRAIFGNPDYTNSGSIYTNKRSITYTQGQVADLVK